MSRSTSHRRLATISIACWAAVCCFSGCYDSELLLQRARDKAIRERLEEIDLGTFRVTLPRNPITSDMTEIDVHLFGQMPHYKISNAERELEEKAYLLHDRTLAKLREFDQRDLVDPDLKKLRSELLATVNSVLDDPSIKAVGFYNMRFIRH